MERKYNVSVCPAPLFFLLAAAFPAGPVYAQDIPAGTEKNTIKNNVIYTDATPKVCFNLGFGLSFPFGDFAKARFNNPGNNFEFKHATGGFAQKGITFDASIGVKLGKKLGLLARFFYQQIEWNKGAISAEASRIHPGTEWEIFADWEIATYTIGIFSRSNFPHKKWLFYEYRVLAGISYTSLPLLNLESSGSRDISYAFNYPVNYWDASDYIGSPVAIVGGSLGIRPSRHFAVMLNADILVTRPVFKNLYADDKMFQSYPPDIRTVKQLITTISPTLQLSFFL